MDAMGVCNNNPVWLEGALSKQKHSLATGILEGTIPSLKHGTCHGWLYVQIDAIINIPVTEVYPRKQWKQHPKPNWTLVVDAESLILLVMLIVQKSG